MDLHGSLKRRVCLCIYIYIYIYIYTHIRSSLRKHSFFSEFLEKGIYLYRFTVP
uniref:Uncharacterized protein n=1 Tax=Octopus bimaculoides TaxID=37653 RepID=A0A0L8GJT3_OCTBM